MITKKSTLFLVFLSCIVGSWLFYLKYSVVSIEDKIRTAKREIVEEKKNQHILRAEWKSLVSPERLQRLATKYLCMCQVEPSQLQEFDPSIFHVEKSKYKKTKKLSMLVNEVLCQNSDKGGM